MDLDDFLDDDFDLEENLFEDDCRDDCLSQEIELENEHIKIESKISMIMEQFEQEQALISIKNDTNGFSVERTYINSKAFHDKFEREILPINKNVSESLYKETGRLLEFVDGLNEERMLAIDARDGHLIVDNFNRKGVSKSTSFNDDEIKLVMDNPNNVILVHNHSYNRPPSGADIKTFAEQDKVKISIVAAHDGYVYAIISADKRCIKEYNEAFKEACRITDNEDSQKTLATKYLYDKNDELNGKLFRMEVL